MERKLNIQNIVHQPENWQEFYAIIEIVAGDSVKYESNKDYGILEIDRFLSTSMIYPCNYGFVPSTLADDGDPLDVILFTPYKIVPNCLVKVRPIGILNMEDEAGNDIKVLTVPVSKVTSYYDNVASFNDLSQLLLDQISHFFTRYKDLEKNKWVKVHDFKGLEDFSDIFANAVNNYFKK